MQSNTKPEKFKIAENLIILRGTRGDIVVGNSKDYRFLHIENGKAFLELLNSAKHQDIGLVDTELIKLLRRCKIVSAENKVPKKPPAGAVTCCGVAGEQTLILPLVEILDKEVYEKALNYILKVVGNNGKLTIKFHGQDPVLAWSCVERIAKIIEDKKTQHRPDIQLKYHFDSSLEKLPENILKWLWESDVSFSVFSPLPEGLENTAQQYDNRRENIRKLSEVCVQAFLITPAVKGNIHQLPQIAEHHANINSTTGFEFPAVQNPNHCWNYGNKEDLPDAEKYSQVLLDIYRAGYVRDDLFSPVSELRHRVVNGGYSAGCTSLYNNVKVIAANGNVYSCLPALHLGCMCIGNINHGLENNAKDVVDEFKSIQKRCWQQCNNCNWRGLCGMYCPLSGDFGCGQCSRLDRILIEKYICKPRLKLIEEIIWDIVKETAAAQQAMAR